MADITHKITINTSKEKVYQAIATVDGLKGWWTEHIDGASAEGQQLTFRFPNTGPVMEVLELMTDEFIKWKCVDGVEDWKNTILTFELEEKDNNCELLFAHSGWGDQSEFYAHCSMKWAVFLLSLKEYCETGKGQPFPDDIKT
ncbi:MAG: SRPBCC domain-containing protein [Candidatus Omnitrophica bacterium]|nr:SRPBCC domain-containing protein [Candidatus Omnitrophota bacterium]